MFLSLFPHAWDVLNTVNYHFEEGLSDDRTLSLYVLCVCYTYTLHVKLKPLDNLQSSNNLYGCSCFYYQRNCNIFLYIVVLLEPA